MLEHLAVSWDEYQKNICNGLGAFQQRGEFVDMTLAADGHLVKVHQLVMSLVSPYIKELISSAHCPHPVVFLNGVSYQTLQVILEYAYTGEVTVSKERIGDFLNACKSLHIRGLDNTMKSAQDTLANMFKTPKIDKYKEHSDDKQTEPEPYIMDNDDIGFQDDDDHDTEEWPQESQPKKRKADDSLTDNPAANTGETEDIDSEAKKKMSRLQYCVSGGGNLQVVLNRYLFTLRHVRKDGSRFWRCSNQQATRCPALLTTVGDNITQRSNPHNHAFHDKQILKRVRAGNMFASLTEVESAAKDKKNNLEQADPVRRGLSETYDQS